MNTLIHNIWNKYHSTKISKKLEEEILKKAKTSHEKSGEKYKLNTHISWWARKYSAIKKSKKSV